MKTAKELLIEFTESSFEDPKKAAAMFSEEGTFEMPYLEFFGFSGRYQGRDEIAGFFQFVRDLYPGFKFENVKILIDTPDQVFGEYEFRAVSSKTGRSVHQLFFGRLVAREGRITLLREALNTVEVARGVYPDGTASIFRDAGDPVAADREDAFSLSLSNTSGGCSSSVHVSYVRQYE